MTNRREVAEKLRQDGERLRGSCCSGAAVFVTVKDIIGISKVINHKAFFDRLADLIDPTCHSVTELEQDGIGAPHRYTTRCSNCGQLWSETSGAILEPNYCPRCGARVVQDDL